MDVLVAGTQGFLAVAGGRLFLSSKRIPETLPRCQETTRLYFRLFHALTLQLSLPLDTEDASEPETVRMDGEEARGR